MRKHTSCHRAMRHSRCIFFTGVSCIALIESTNQASKVVWVAAVLGGSLARSYEALHAKSNTTNAATVIVHALAVRYHLLLQKGLLLLLMCCIQMAL